MVLAGLVWSSHISVADTPQGTEETGPMGDAAGSGSSSVGGGVEEEWGRSLNQVALDHSHGLEGGDWCCK